MSAIDQAGICVTIDRKDSYDDDDMKVVVDEGGRLRQIGKRISAGVNAESIGLLAFRNGGAAQFSEAIERAIRTSEGTTIWYLRVIYQIAQQADVWTFDISGEEWGEVDFPEDVETARELVTRWDSKQACRLAGGRKEANDHVASESDRSKTCRSRGSTSSFLLRLAPLRRA